MTEAFTDTGLLIAKGMVRPWCNKGQVVWFKCQKPEDYNYFKEQQNQSGSQKFLTSRKF